MTIFYRDGIVSEQAIAPFDFTDRGLLLGDGVFDTALVLGGRVFRIEAHLDRLFDAARALDIGVAHDEVRRCVATLAARGGRGVLRTNVTRGPGPRGLRPPSTRQPTIFASLAPLSDNVAFASLTLDVAKIRRNESSPTSRFKTLNYLDGVMATAAVAEAGFDEALFLNCSGRVASTATGNLFVTCGGRIVTPPLAEGVLPGIIRAFILAECGGQERPLELAELFSADAVFVTNSVRLVAPVTRIGDTLLASTTDDRVKASRHRLWTAVCDECGISLPLPDGIDGAETIA
jgi:branched-chain amino acid aminotransferase